MSALATTAYAQQPAGSIRGVVLDQDFDVPLAAALVTNLETGATVTTTDQGNYVFPEVPAGTYTLVFSREGYVRQVKTGVVVVAGRLTDVDAALAGEFTEMEEFVVQDVLQVGAGTEAALLELRFESPALMDSISADLMSRAGASDASEGLKLVTGASVQDGKFAVIRGLPDRYVNSQMNGVRLPSADEDKRAVELDQFPAAVIESIQVSKTFTPDQQGDASGGAVNLRLRGIPEETVLGFKSQVGYNSQVTGESEFLTYDGGGVNFLGLDDGDRDVQSENLGSNWDGAAGVSSERAPIDYKWSADAGKKFELASGVVLGGFASVFYERDSSFFDDGVDDSLWVNNIGEDLTPETSQGTPEDGDFKTALFDVTQGKQSVQWGGLGTLGFETEKHLLGLTALYTHAAEDVATLAEDTRGKLFYFPDYVPDDPNDPGNTGGRFSAPYLRTETLEYTERTTATLQLRGNHELPLDPFEFSGLTFQPPQLDWTLARSFARMDQPDKRQFGALFLPESFNPALPGIEPPLWVPFKPGANFTFGNFQRIFKVIEEDGDQYALDLELPFERWGEEPGYVKLGLFADHVERTFEQETFSNFTDVGAQFSGGFDDSWSAVFPEENHAITGSLQDVDYDGDQRISAAYGMVDLPLSATTSLMAGARFESSSVSIVNDPEENAKWYPPGASGAIDFEPGQADVSFSQDDALPAIGLTFVPTPAVTLRASYSETVAHQTFKELSPIVQQEFLGGPIFIGNPELGMSALENYDLRLDYAPVPGSLVSLSWFHKDIQDPIEYVQRPSNDFTFTSPENYPEGDLSGYELELRQDLEQLADGLSGLSFGANATFIDSEVTLPDDEILAFAALEVPITSRDMTSAPEYLYNLYLTYDLADATTQVALFYTVQGDTLVAGAGESVGNFVPSIYAREVGTLNLSLSRRIGQSLKLQLQAKNLTNPEIETVYRSEFIDGDATRTSFKRGSELSLSLSVNL
ncbi:MAG: TonB-dependent receptor [Planctomycetes bacterium]|nr:TonB-dependent receptor [Planctomycetota bacterium]